MKGGLLERNELACLRMLLLLCLSWRGGDLLLSHSCKVLWISCRQWTLKLASGPRRLRDGGREMICEQVQLSLDGAVRSTTTAADGQGALLLLLLLSHEELLLLLLLLSLIVQHLWLLLKLLLLLLLMLHHPVGGLHLLLLDMRATGNRRSRTIEWKQRQGEGQSQNRCSISARNLGIGPFPF